MKSVVPKNHLPLIGWQSLSSMPAKLVGLCKRVAKAG